MVGTDVVALFARTSAGSTVYCEYPPAAEVADSAILATIAAMQEWQHGAPMRATRA